MTTTLPSLRVRQLGCLPYEQVWQAMSQFTNERDEATLDELWVVEHQPVYTQGQAGKPEHLLKPSDIPVVQTDRGGQVTYHGPGQLILYPLIDLRRYQLGVRDLVTLLENLVVEWLAQYGVEAYPKADAPGVYIKKDQNDAKIASLGLRIRRGCSFHGVSININMDLSPFQWINPCGYEGLQMTQLAQEIKQMPSNEQCQQELIEYFCSKLQVTVAGYEKGLP